MNQYIKLKKSNCRNCYKCIRHCPVKSIKFSENQAHIVESDCILCGMCFVSCPQNAKEIRNDIGKVKELLASGKPVYVSLAPSFAANFEGVNFRMVEELLLRMGFAKVEETAIGATIVKREYENMMREGMQDIIISSCCSSINLLIEKHFPQLLHYLAPVMSPMQAHCKKMKEEHEEICTVFIGPCIAKKSEAEDYEGLVDAVLTFEEFSEWIEAEGLTFQEISDDSYRGRTRIFPTDGGILASMIEKEESYAHLSFDGVDNCISVLREIEEGNISKSFIEMSACVGSCVGGPAMNRKNRKLLKDTIAVKKISGESDFEVLQPASEEIKKDFRTRRMYHEMPTEVEIRDILKKMGKTKPEDELNCGTCGYNTCRDKAIAVYQGKADIHMCLPYMKEKAESFSDNIIYNTPNAILVLNENLEIQQINSSAKTMFHVKRSSDVVGTQVVSVMDPRIFMDVLSEDQNIYNRRMFLDDAKKFVEITVVHDKTYHLIIGIIRDVTEEAEEKRKKEEVSRQSIEITDKVIQKQMRIVQEIASLLGETTAETKVALNKLKETLKNE
ncbi:MAG: PAS domain-containing protein [Clostridia bacterium]|nr:PAS domain-containing protein [Clostridia bacterium]